MKIPKTQKSYCPFCKKHTLHKLTEVKSKTRGTLKRGSIARARWRGRGRGAGNKGRWGSKPTKPKRSGSKISKKINILLRCEVCKKAHTPSKSERAKKIEWK